jgi:hypothetical protein
MAIGNLLDRQNPDGGWPYVRGGSWVEPTVYSVLALLSAGEIGPARCGLAWIRSVRRSDGGWAPRADIDESTWVTALVALLPPEHLGEAFHQSAIAWLLDTQGRETTTLYRIREWLLGNPDTPDRHFPGWPWVPGTAAWVGPTCLAILALAKHHQRRPSAAARGRIEKGQTFLLRHMCAGGGWNHGGVNALGYASRPYPETTGMALAALRGATSPKIDLSLAVAREFLRQCRSADASNWLRLGLRAHGQLPVEYCPPPGLSCRTVPETSLHLALAAADRGRGIFGV